MKLWTIFSEDFKESVRQSNYRVAGQSYISAIRRIVKALDIKYNPNDPFIRRSTGIALERIVRDSFVTGTQVKDLIWFINNYAAMEFIRGLAEKDSEENDSNAEIVRFLKKLFGRAGYNESLDMVRRNFDELIQYTEIKAYTPREFLESLDITPQTGAKVDYKYLTS